MIESVLDLAIDLAPLLINQSDVSEVISQDECLKLTDMAEWFLQFKLTRGKDVPVIINGKSDFGDELLNKLIESDIFVNFDRSATEYCIIVGSFNQEANAFEHAVIYTANEIDTQLKDLFKDKDIIALQ